MATDSGAGDVLRRFLIESTAVRGEWVQLRAAWQTVLARHPYPAAVQQHLGSLYAAVALIAATLKFEGSLLVQITGPGPVRMLLAQADHAGNLRGLARFRDAAVEASAARQDAVDAAAPELNLADPGAVDVPLETLIGADARLMLTLEPANDGGQRHQGVVALEQVASVAAAFDHYFRASEQLPTRLWLAADETAAGGLLLQGLPDDSGQPLSRESEDWNRATILAATVTPDELLEQPSETLLGRLFAEETVRVFDAERRRFRCSCSRERIESTLRSLGRDELEEILREQGEAAVTCEFCNAHYRFDAVDLATLLRSPAFGRTTTAAPARH